MYTEQIIIEYTEILVLKLFFVIYKMFTIIKCSVWKYISDEGFSPTVILK